MFTKKRCISCKEVYDRRYMWAVAGGYICDCCFHGLPLPNKKYPEPEKKLKPKSKYGKCFLIIGHKIIEVKGRGFICKYCGKPKGQCYTK